MLRRRCPAPLGRDNDSFLDETIPGATVWTTSQPFRHLVATRLAGKDALGFTHRGSPTLMHRGANEAGHFATDPDVRHVHGLHASVFRLQANAVGFLIKAFDGDFIL